MPTNALEPRPREGSIATRPTSTGIQSPESLRKEPPRERHGFEVYLQLKNSGSRAIKKLEWDFLFLDSQSGSELKRFNIRSKSRIRSGEVKFLTKQVLPGLFFGKQIKTRLRKG